MTKMANAVDVNELDIITLFGPGNRSKMARNVVLVLAVLVVIRFSIP